MLPSKHPRPEREAGFMLLAVVVMVALVLLALSVAAPIVSKELRRDKEVESEHRSQQYVRAIRLYYRQFKTYPPSLDALEKSNNIRFLRQKYTDPLTGKNDWRLIHVGEQKTTVKGFFGEPLGGLDSSGAGTSAASMGAGFAAIGASSNMGGTTTIGATSGLAAGFAGATVGTAGAGGSAGAAGSSGASGSTGASGTSGSSGFGSGGLGQIMGVGSARTGSSILTPNEQSTYNTWEFLYDPRIEQLYAKSNILGGGVSSGSGSSFGKDATTGLSGATGASGSSSGFGSFGGFGSSGTSGATGSSGSSGASGSTGATGNTLGSPIIK